MLSHGGHDVFSVWWLRCDPGEPFQRLCRLVQPQGRHGLDRANAERAALRGC